MHIKVIHTKCLMKKIMQNDINVGQKMLDKNAEGYTAIESL